MDENPYESPKSPSADAPASPAARIVAGERASPKLALRYIAALFDQFVVMFLAVLAAKTASNDLPFLQVILLVGAFLGYYFVFEGLFGATPGKLVTGLRVRQYDGSRSTWTQCAIRSVFRLLEVNPLFLGSLPAAVCIVFSRHRQRWGDMAAGTVVVVARG